MEEEEIKQHLNPNPNSKPNPKIDPYPYTNPNRNPIHPIDCTNPAEP